MGKILIVEDDTQQLYNLESLVNSKLGYETISSNGGIEALNILTSEDSKNIDLVILDLAMPEVDGFAVLRETKPLLPSTPFIVTMVEGEAEAALKAIQLGASDFLLKPVQPERLKISASNALRIKALKNNLSRLSRNNGGQVAFSDIIGRSSRLLEALKLGRKASVSDIPILIEGESGTGKELLAMAIHGSSSRAGRPFLSVNSLNTSDQQIEIALFGADDSSGRIKTLGKLREANGGTVYIDEIGELRLETQAKLLRAIESGKVTPYGSGNAFAFSARIVAGTAKNLSLEVARGRFREDLYYALNGLSIPLPALREREDDVAELAQFFLKKHTAMEGKIVSRITEDALTVLRCYIWPGNIRQLDNTIFRAVALTGRNYLDSSDFAYLLPKNASDATKHLLPLYNFSQKSCISGFTAFSEDGHIKKLEDIEAEIINLALEKYNGRISEVARRLGVGRSTIYRKIEGAQDTNPGNTRNLMKNSYSSSFSEYR